MLSQCCILFQTHFFSFKTLLERLHTHLIHMVNWPWSNSQCFEVKGFSNFILNHLTSEFPFERFGTFQAAFIPSLCIKGLISVCEWRVALRCGTIWFLRWRRGFCQTSYLDQYDLLEKHRNWALDATQNPFPVTECIKTWNKTDKWKSVILCK